MHNHGERAWRTLSRAHHAAEIKQTFATLQKFHPADIAAGTAATDEIQTAYLLGNTKLNTYIVAVSVGSVFFGANTYIGNGPNFMVKAIADHQKVHTPKDFLGVYRPKFTLPFMLPMLVTSFGWYFFRWDAISGQKRPSSGELKHQ